MDGIAAILSKDPVDLPLLLESLLKLDNDTTLNLTPQQQKTINSRNPGNRHDLLMDAATSGDVETRNC